MLNEKLVKIKRKPERSYSDKLYDFFTIADFLYKNITKD